MEYQEPDIAREPGGDDQVPPVAERPAERKTEGRKKMSRQPLLWVILSVTLLVVLILVAGLLLLRDNPTAPVAKVTEPPDNNYFDLPFQSTPLPGIITPAPTQATPNGGIQKQEFAYGESTTETSATPAPRASAEPAHRQTPAPTKQQRGTTARQTSASAVRTQPGPMKTSTQYWIQTGSYTSKSKADSNNAVLIDNGLSGVVVTKNLNGDTYFRVRVGPYRNKAEAEKFLSSIKKIDGFADSYIALDFSAKK
jgi:DedD protein